MRILWTPIALCVVILMTGCVSAANNPEHDIVVTNNTTTSVPVPDEEIVSPTEDLELLSPNVLATTGESPTQSFVESNIDSELSTELDSAYYAAVSAFREVLQKKRDVYYRDSDTIMKFYEYHNTRFALVDLTGDGVPELALNGAGFNNFKPGSQESFWSARGPRILVYENENVYSWFEGFDYMSYIEILDCKVVLNFSKSRDGMWEEYYYIKFDSYGNIVNDFSCAVPVNVEEHLEKYGGDYAFRVSDGQNNSHYPEFVTRDEFEEFTAPYFALNYGMVEWVDYKEWIETKTDGSQIDVDAYIRKYSIVAS